MTLLECVQGRSNSCLYFHPAQEIRVEVHGNSFSGLGAKNQLERFAKELVSAGLWRLVARGSYITWNPWNATENRRPQQAGQLD